ncbi:MAG TPA: hypothetical protein VHD14_06085 [Pseudolabrys sp.]|jgi:hypothetical protein|nr:hypothetical protein [Pseudolabrys sp.]
MRSYRIVDTAKVTLWLSFWLAAIFVLALFNPRAPSYPALADVLRAPRSAAGYDWLCEKLGKPFGTPEHVQCVLDRQE